MSTPTRYDGGRRGGALLAVMWVAAILAAIAFSVANTVRAETERTATTGESVKAYYLATSGVERMLMYADWEFDNAEPPSPHRTLTFPNGLAVVDVIPEASKLSLNTSPPQEFERVLLALGVVPERARQIASAIADWRSGNPATLSEFDQYYLSLNPSFRARHASFEEIEELLLVKGMTPDLYYGTLVRDAQGRLLPQAGFRDCVSVYGSAGPLDANSVQPAVLAAIGASPEAINAIVQRRHARPFKSIDELAPLGSLIGPAMARLTVGGLTIFTYRSTGVVRLPDGRMSDAARTVSAMVKFNRPQRVGRRTIQPDLPPIQVLRWYDN